jgi:hypothetical protein
MATNCSKFQKVCCPMVPHERQPKEDNKRVRRKVKSKKAVML